MGPDALTPLPSLCGAASEPFFQRSDGCGDAGVVAVFINHRDAAYAKVGVDARSRAALFAILDPAHVRGPIFLSLLAWVAASVVRRRGS